MLVDQFEELFRFRRVGRAGSGDGVEDEAEAFVHLLLEAAGQDELPIYVLLTMRSDFLGDCVQFPGLPEAINRGQYLIPRLDRRQRRAVIEGPVRVGGAEIDPPLLQRLLNDVGDDPDQLPILQHALMRTVDLWLERTGGEAEPIGLTDYLAAGTMGEALARHAEEAWRELDLRGRRVGEALFKCLTERTVDGQGIRRPTSRRRDRRRRRGDRGGGDSGGRGAAGAGACVLDAAAAGACWLRRRWSTSPTRA